MWYDVCPHYCLLSTTLRAQTTRETFHLLKLPWLITADVSGNLYHVFNIMSTTITSFRALEGGSQMDGPGERSDWEERKVKR